jgi:hypothetical protein
LNQRPNSLNPFSKGVNLFFLSFCPFSGIVLHLFHKNFEFVFSILWLCLTIFWTFNKNFTEILIIYDVQIPRNDVASGTICEWWIVPRTIRKVFSFEVINAEVLQHMSMIKDFVFLSNIIHILDGRKRNLNEKPFSQTCVHWPLPLSNIVILSNKWCFNIFGERLYALRCFFLLVIVLSIFLRITPSDYSLWSL